MVLPYSSGQLVRSLVRIPGSGLDRQAEPTILDLSKVSPLASTVPVPRSVPVALSRNKNVTSPPPPPSPSLDKLAKAAVQGQVSSAASTSHKRPREEDDEARQGSNSKVGRKDNSSPAQTQDSQTNRTTPVATVTVSLVPSQQIQQVTINGGPRQVLISCNGTVQLSNVQIVRAGPSGIQQASTTPSSQGGVSNGALLQEVNQLKKENEELNEKLKKFQNIFRNKDSLRYIANRVLKAQ
ncbi:uncharacterized protein [Palaemon carinicauda]|uniref:uncharacterized protein n=1 Tax=Palaemon carinicauda TaxID=392227 RepID=UPI0035B5A045